MSQTARWAGRSIARPEDAQVLDLAAARHEFEGNLPRAQAEQAAYDAYRRGASVQAAAYHLRGMRAADARGDAAAAQQHRAAYEQHARVLGVNPAGELPDEVRQLLQQPGAGRFRPHAADALDKHEETAALAKTTKELKFRHERKGDMMFMHACRAGATRPVVTISYYQEQNPDEIHLESISAKPEAQTGDGLAALHAWRAHVLKKYPAVKSVLHEPISQAGLLVTNAVFGPPQYLGNAIRRFTTNDEQREALRGLPRLATTDKYGMLNGGAHLDARHAINKAELLAKVDERDPRKAAGWDPKDSRTWTNAGLTHGPDKAHLHDATCLDSRCGGGYTGATSECKWRAEMPPGSKAKNYTHMLPSDVSGFGYQLWLTHEPQQGNDDYEHIHATLVGPGMAQKPVTSDNGAAYSTPGYCNSTRYMKDPEATGANWPSHQAWLVCARMHTPKATTRQGRELKALIERAGPSVEAATRHMIAERGEVDADSDWRKYYAHSPTMLKIFRKRK